MDLDRRSVLGVFDCVIQENGNELDDLGTIGMDRIRLFNMLEYGDIFLVCRFLEAT